MRRSILNLFRYGRIVILLAALGGGGGCAADAGARAEDPAAARSESARKLSPEQVTAAGDQAARAGEYDRAVNFYRQAIEAQPTGDLWFRVGWIYNQLDKKAFAAQAFAQTIGLDPGHAGAHEELGLLLLENKQREQAAVYLQRASELDVKRWRSHNALGVLADARKDYPAAMGHYEAALAVVPDSPLVLSNLGYSHYLAGNLDQAQARYQQVLAADPGNHAALANLGLLYARRARYDDAMAVMSSVMDKAKAHNDIGYIAFQNGDLDEAERLLAEAIRRSPSYYATAQENMLRVRSAKAEAAASAGDETETADAQPSPDTVSASTPPPTPVARRAP
jgi:tetratricopeptide (TPR) repeat protein